MTSDFDLFPLPEDSICLDIDKEYEPMDLAEKALRIVISDRDLNNKIKINSYKKDEGTLKLNKFFIQIATCTNFDEEIIVSSDKWFKNNKLPHLLLAAKVDTENNIVNFSGVLTGNEIRDLIGIKTNYKKYIKISIENFQGDIDLLFNYIDLLKIESINNTIFDKKNIKNKNIDLRISSTVIIASALGLVFGPRIFQPRLITDISKLNGNNLLIASNTRSNDLNSKNVCILSPQFNSLNLNEIKYISVDKPVFIFKEKLNEITLIKDNNIIWQEIATLDKRIQSPIIWPITSIENDKIYTLRIRPVKSSLNEFKEISFKADNNSFQKINLIEKKLGTKESRWIKEINKNLNNNTDLSLALLFSENRPKSEMLDKVQQKFISETICKNN